tara:strand:- start:2141 stop:2401 length:261 start_codon:yes stop_codon:yes gene_type:complete
MITISEIEEIIKSAIVEVIEDKQFISLDKVFIGGESEFESIDIVQIIGLIEDKLENKGYGGYDLLEKTFENDRLTFNDLSILIQKY